VPPTPQTAGPWTGTDIQGTTYTLAITENTSRAVYVVQNGDSYVLTDGTAVGTSRGTVVSSTGMFLILQPENTGAPTFTVTKKSDCEIIGFSGTVTLTEGTTTIYIPVPAIGPVETGVYPANMTDPDYYLDGKLFWVYTLDENNDGNFINGARSIANDSILTEGDFVNCLYMGVNVIFRKLDGMLTILHGDGTWSRIDTNAIVLDGDKIAADFATTFGCSWVGYDPANAGTKSIADIINSMATEKILRVEAEVSDMGIIHDWYITVKRVL
jgi:hypothetical protein